MGQFRISRVVEFRLETIVEYAVHGLRSKELDAVFISYTNLWGLEASDLVAAELKLPVITSSGDACRDPAGSCC